MNTWHIFLLPQFPNPDKTCSQTRLNNKWATQERHFLRFPLRKLISPFFASTWERRKRNRVVIALRRISFPLLLSLPCSIDSLRRRRAGHTHAPPWAHQTVYIYLYILYFAMHIFFFSQLFFTPIPLCVRVLFIFFFFFISSFFFNALGSFRINELLNIHLWWLIGRF